MIVVRRAADTAACSSEKLARENGGLQMLYFLNESEDEYEIELEPAPGEGTTVRALLFPGVTGVEVPEDWDPDLEMVLNLEGEASNWSMAELLSPQATALTQPEQQSGTLKVVGADNAFTRFRQRRTELGVSPECAKQTPGDAARWDSELVLGTKGTASVVEVRHVEADDPSSLWQERNKWLSGHVTIFEVTSLPLGWSPGQWVNTEWLLAGETAARAQLELGDVSEADQFLHGRSADASDSTGTLEQSGRTTQQQQIEAQVRARQIDVGLSPIPDLGISNPLGSLAAKVTGALQIGFGASSGASSGASTADVAQTVRNELIQSARRKTISEAQAGLDLARSTTQQMRLGTLRNLDTERALNVAEFSVDQIWLVETQKVARRNVVLVPVQGIDSDFSAEEIFVHRHDLAEVFLDPVLLPDLEYVAQHYGSVDSGPPEEKWHGSDFIHMRGWVKDSTSRDGTVKVEVSLETPIGLREVVTELDALVEGDEIQHPIAIPFDEWRLKSLRFYYNNPRARQDVYAEIIGLQIRTDRSDDSGSVLLHLDRVQLPAQRWTPSFEVSVLIAEQSDFVRSVRRLQLHLNAHRIYYRSALFLRMDGASRSVLFGEAVRSGQADGLVPSDSSPIGIVGHYLAFPRRTNEEKLQAKAFLDLVTIPTGATVAELLYGLGERSRPKGPDSIEDPYVALPAKDGALSWPSFAHRPFPAEVAKILQGRSVAEAEAPTAPNLAPPSPPSGEEIKGLVAEVREMLQALKSEAATTTNSDDDTG